MHRTETIAVGVYWKQKTPDRLSQEYVTDKKIKGLIWGYRDLSRDRHTKQNKENMRILRFLSSFRTWKRYSQYRKFIALTLHTGWNAESVSRPRALLKPNHSRTNVRFLWQERNHFFEKSRPEIVVTFTSPRETVLRCWNLCFLHFYRLSLPSVLWKAFLFRIAFTRKYISGL